MTENGLVAACDYRLLPADTLPSPLYGESFCQGPISLDITDKEE